MIDKNLDFMRFRLLREKIVLEGKKGMRRKQKEESRMLPWWISV
jgi:hypothetical protein